MSKTIKVESDIFWDILAAHQNLFIDTFGRTPRSGDPVIFDISVDGSPLPRSPAQIHHDMLGLFIEAKLSNRFIYIYERTGLMPIDPNILDSDKRSDYDAALVEFNKMTHKQQHKWRHQLKTKFSQSGEMRKGK